MTAIWTSSWSGSSSPNQSLGRLTPLPEKWVLGGGSFAQASKFVVFEEVCLELGWILFGYERIDFVGNPIIFDQSGEECSSKQQSPAIFAPRSERELQRDIHEVRRAVADIRQESENDEDHQRRMRVTGRDAH